MRKIKRTYWQEYCSNLGRSTPIENVWSQETTAESSISRSRNNRKYELKKAEILAKKVNQILCGNN